MYGVIVTRVARGSGGWPWCARLLSAGGKYGLEREFIRGTPDYTFTRQRRGTLLVFPVPPGLYEVQDNINQSRGRRYFARVDDAGEITEISREEMLTCLKNAILE